MGDSAASSNASLVVKMDFDVLSNQPSKTQWLYSIYIIISPEDSTLKKGVIPRSETKSQMELWCHLLIGLGSRVLYLCATHGN